MPKRDLIEALPDLVLLVKRDGTPIAHAGGKAVAELGGCDAVDRERFVPAWSESTATLVRQLVRNAIADRSPVEARFQTGDCCIAAGRFQFDGYVDGSREPAPAAAEQQINLEEARVFPAIASAGKPCWWKRLP